MNLSFYQVDAFTDQAFGGNPAAVIILKEEISDELMQKIAAENNLSETAFLLHYEDNRYRLRWFTPLFEIDLCGHATLASAHTLFNHFAVSGVLSFETRSGTLKAEMVSEGIQLDFPSRPPERLTGEYEDLFNISATEAWGSRDLMLLFETEDDILALSPNLDKIKDLEYLGVIATAPGTESDFVSRFFAPKAGVDEDPVTGSAHSTLVPYWSDRLKKDTLSAIQLSQRKGFIYCALEGNRVLLRGSCVTVIEGKMLI